jgi:hypothetical protein
MSEIELTEQEKYHLEFALEDVEEHRLAAHKASIESFEGEDEVHQRFDPGTYGCFEVGDRAYVAMEMWDGYVSDHPSIAMDPEAYRLASIASSFMNAVYQRMMTLDWEGDEAKKAAKEEEDKCPT